MTKTKVKTKTLGARSTEVVAALEKKGHKNLSAACRSENVDYGTVLDALRDGLRPNPRMGTVNALTRLGLLTLVESL